MTDTLLTPTNAPQVGSPDWWLRRLEKQLDDRQQKLRVYDAYYEGEHPLAFASEKFLKAFGGMFRAFADNWCDLVVDAVEERLNVEGFRFGESPEADQDAWDTWQRNQLDVDSQLAHTDALIHGESAAIVWADDEGTGAEITVESAHQVICAYEPGSRRERAAALKKWLEDDDFLHATLYLRDGIYKYRSARAVKSYDTGGSGSRVDWVPREVGNEGWPLANPLGVVPVVPLCNRPRLLSAGHSEIAKVIPVQNAVNKLVADMLVASEFGAFRQRWVTGMEIPTDPETNQPVEPFRIAVDRLLMGMPEPGGPDIHFGEFSETNLANFVTAIEMLVQHIASQTRTPPHYFYLRGQFPSGEAIKSAETGLVAKSKRKQRPFGESWEEVMRLSFKVTGDARGDVIDAETIWGDPESRSEAQHVDAVLKMMAVGVPQQALWEELDFSPQQIERFRTMLWEQAREQSLLGADLFGGGPIPPGGSPPTNGNAPPAPPAPTTGGPMP